MLLVDNSPGRDYRKREATRFPELTDLPHSISENGCKLADVQQNRIKAVIWFTFPLATFFSSFVALSTIRCDTRGKGK